MFLAIEVRLTQLEWLLPLEIAFVRIKNHILSSYRSIVTSCGQDQTSNDSKLPMHSKYYFLHPRENDKIIKN